MFLDLSTNQTSQSVNPEAVSAEPVSASNKTAETLLPIVVEGPDVVEKNAPEIEIGNLFNRNS